MSAASLDEPPAFQSMQVGVVLPDGTVELRTVNLGRDFGQAVEILGGVSPTNQVIINPSDSLASGMTVRVAEGTFSMLDTGFLSVHDSEPV